jgi:putative ABC transport system ATP-binding protein
VTEALVELDDVRVEYGRGPGVVRAVRGVSLTVGRGDHVALVGPSGSGKSTLLGLLGLLHAPTGGRVVVEGEDRAGLDDRELSGLRRRLTGFVFQQHHLLPHLDALGNVEAALMLRGLGRRRRRARAQECLDRVGLADRASHRPGELSGGEQQRVALARAIAPEPPLLLADEPTGNLDSDNQSRLLDLLDALHDPLVAAHAPRRLHMTDGHLDPAS